MVVSMEKITKVLDLNRGIEQFLMLVREKNICKEEEIRKEKVSEDKKRNCEKEQKRSLFF